MPETRLRRASAQMKSGSRIRNTGTYVYSSGSFIGSLTNLNTVVLNNSLSLSGVVNSGTVSVGVGRTLTCTSTLQNDGTLTVSGGTISSSAVSDALQVGSLSTGTFIMTGGSLLGLSGSFIRIGLGATGVATMSSGLISAGTLTVGGSGGNGQMSISGGSVSLVSGRLQLGQGGSLTQSGGGIDTGTFADFSGNAGYSITAGSLSVGSAMLLSGAATVTQTGGSVIVGTTAGSISLTGTSTYNLVGGTATAATLSLASGTFNQGTAGFLSVGNIVQSGGTVTGRLTNFGTFTYNSGAFLGRLVNQGTLIFNTAFNAGDGMENYGTFAIPLNRTYNFDGAGLLNGGTLTFTGGIVTGTGGLTNDFAGVMTGTGFVYTSVANNGNFSLTGLFSVGGPLSNAGVISIGAFNLRPSLSMSNVGIVDLGGGAVTGSGGILTNSIGGVIQGRGAIAMSLANNGLISAQGPVNSLLTLTSLTTNSSGGELRIADNNSLNIQTAFTSNGLITLNGANAALNGGTISNGGTVVGLGRVSSSINNNGVVRASGGQLQLSAVGNTNNGAGRLEVLAGATLFVAEGIATNNGVISLVGGTYDNSSRTITNNGIIAGKGTFRSSGLTNSKLVSFADGATDVFGPVSNVVAGPPVTLQVTNCTTTFYDNVTNGNGAVIKNTAGVIRFLGGFTNNGVYTSDPADNYFGSVTNGPTGLLEGGVGDRFFMSGTFINQGIYSTTGSVLQTGNLINSGTFTHLDGELVVAGTITNSGTMTLGGNLGLSSSLKFNLDGGQLKLADGPHKLLFAKSIDLSGPATIDLRNNDIAIDYDTLSPLSAIRAAVQSGAIMSSLANGSTRTVGYASAADIGLSSIDGKALDATAVVLRYTAPGDSNLDLAVNSIDFNRLLAGYGTISSALWSSGDFNRDGKINTLDFNLLAGNFGTSAAAPSLGAIVPEPAGFGVLACASLLLAKRRRHLRRR